MARAYGRVYGRFVRWLRVELAATSAADRLLAVVLAVVGELEVWLLGAGGASRGLTAAAVLVMTLPLAVRRRHPLLAIGSALAGFSAIYATTDISSDDDAFVAWVVMLVAVYTAGAYTRGRAAIAGALGALAFPLVLGVTDPDGFSASALVFFGSIALPPYVAGVAIARRRGREAVLERHATTLDAERERAAAAAVAEERARIARELHDVVAHGVSTIVVQAQGGARMVRIEPDEAEQAFVAIERTGRQALAEMRRLLGMLRAADHATALAPQPGVERLEELIEGVRGPAYRSNCRSRGRSPRCRAASTCRPIASCRRRSQTRSSTRGPRGRVRLRYLAGAVELEVSDDGAGNGDRGKARARADRDARTRRNLWRSAGGGRTTVRRLPHPRATAVRAGRR